MTSVFRRCRLAFAYSITVALRLDILMCDGDCSSVEGCLYLTSSLLIGVSRLRSDF